MRRILVCVSAVHIDKIHSSLGNIGEVSTGCNTEDQLRLGIEHINKCLEPNVLNFELFQVRLKYKENNDYPKTK